MRTISAASPCRHRSYSPKRECQLFGRSHQKGPPRISDIANKSVRDSPWWNPHKIPPMEPTRIRHPRFPPPRSPIECNVIGHARAGPGEPQQQLWPAANSSSAAPCSARRRSCGRPRWLVMPSRAARLARRRRRRPGLRGCPFKEPAQAKFTPRSALRIPFLPRSRAHRQVARRVRAPARRARADGQWRQRNRPSRAADRSRSS